MRIGIPALLTLFALAGASAAAQAREGIVWFESDMPPLTILSGEHAGKGAGDIWSKELHRLLPEFDHLRSTANVARSLEELKRRENACGAIYLKTAQREEILVFSQPFVWLQPNGFITLHKQRAKLTPFLNSREELRLDELIASRRLRISAAGSRAFGGQIDPALRAGLKTGVVRNFNTSDLFASGLLQVDKNLEDIDAVIGYANELHWSILRLKLQPEKFWFIPIAGETALIPVHVACARTPMGQQIIQRVNQIIATSELVEVARQAYRAWLPADAAHHYDQQFKRLHRPDDQEKNSTGKP